MSSTVNHVTLIGRLGTDPEKVITRKGTTMARLAIATDSGTSNNPRTEWHKVLCFDQPAEYVLEYCRKGDLLYVDGRLEYHRLDDDAPDARKLSSIRAWRITSLARASSRLEGAARASGEETGARAMADNFAEEAIPF